MKAYYFESEMSDARFSSSSDDEIRLGMCSDVFMIIEHGCCSYEAELEAWEKLEAAATPLVLDEPRLNSDTSPPEHDPQEEYLKKLKIEVRHSFVSCFNAKFDPQTSSSQGINILFVNSSSNMDESGSFLRGMIKLRI